MKRICYILFLVLCAFFPTKSPYQLLFCLEIWEIPSCKYPWWKWHRFERALSAASQKSLLNIVRGLLQAMGKYVLRSLKSLSSAWTNTPHQSGLGTSSVSGSNSGNSDCTERRGWGQLGHKKRPSEESPRGARPFVSMQGMAWLRQVFSSCYEGSSQPAGLLPDAFTSLQLQKKSSSNYAKGFWPNRAWTWQTPWPPVTWRRQPAAPVWLCPLNSSKPKPKLKYPLCPSQDCWAMEWLLSWQVYSARCRRHFRFTHISQLCTAGCR